MNCLMTVSLVTKVSFLSDLSAGDSLLPFLAVKDPAGCSSKYSHWYELLGLNHDKLCPNYYFQYFDEIEGTLV